MGRYQLKSMTAYGRGVALFPYGRLTVEIQSVNRRFLEVNINLPRPLIRYEVEVRKKISSQVARGALNVSIFWKAEGEHSVSVTPNLALAHALKAAWERIAVELNLGESPALALLAQEEDLLLYEEELKDEQAFQIALNEALHKALDGLIAMKVQEGGLLKEDLVGRLAKLRATMEGIEARAGEGSEKYRKKLQERLEHLFPGSLENEERILREIAVYAERVDFTEEIVRFKGHLEQFELLLEKPLENALEARGKTFDFLLQELLREANTLGSKASDLFIAQSVIAIKSELEKIREQVQNIE